MKHDVIAFTTAVAETMAAAGHAEASRWLHYGLTSNDVVDTAQALQMRQACGILLRGLESLRAVLKRRALEFQHTVQIGRTHGVHAEPITFGLKLAIWYEEAGRNLARLRAAAEDLRVGKISGAVGTFAHIGPEVEERICARLDLKPAPVASQVIQRDRHAHFVCRAGAGDGAVREDRARSAPPAAHRSARGGGVFRARAKGQLGHAAQAQPGHLRADLRPGARGARQRAGGVRGYRAVARARHLAFFGGARDPARFDHPDRLPAGQDHAAWWISLLVYPERMRRNLDLTRGLVFSGQLLLDLAAAGMLREQAYRLVQAHAMRAWEEEGDFRAAIEADPEIRAWCRRSRSPRRSRWSGNCATWTRFSRACSENKAARTKAGSRFPLFLVK